MEAGTCGHASECGARLLSVPPLWRAHSEWGGGRSCFAFPPSDSAWMDSGVGGAYLPHAMPKIMAERGALNRSGLNRRITIGKCDNWNVNHRKSGNEYNNKDGM